MQWHVEFRNHYEDDSVRHSRQIGKDQVLQPSINRIARRPRFPLNPSFRIRRRGRGSRNRQLPSLSDHLSVNPRSRQFHSGVVIHDVGIKLNDKEHTNADEYCISEGWIVVAAGKALDRKGNPLMIKLKDRVEAFYR